jgi:alkylation response protein AidB-like acyl-CoA dehydrogenase
VDFTLTTEQQTFRAAVQATVNAVDTTHIRRSVLETGVAHDNGLNGALAEAGLFLPAVPGPDSDPVLTHLLFSEMEKAGVPYEGIAVNLLVAGVLESVGTDMQRQQVVTALLSGKKNICLGYSEPDAGSDLTQISTRSRRNGDDWAISGQKIWTTLAQDAEWMFTLTRTDAPHNGELNSDVGRRAMTMFLIPMSTKGIRVDPIQMMGGERVNAVFLDEVAVSDGWRVGEVDRAWEVMALALSLERGVLGNSQLAVSLLARAVDWFAATRDERGLRYLDDPVVRETIAAIAVENQVGALLGLRAAVDKDGPAGVAGSQVKVFVAERYVRAARLLQDLCGPDGLVGHKVPTAAADGWVEHHVNHSLLTRIAGGTTEINRNNIAERLLGLPRVR